MEHSTLMESGDNFALCENCHNITVFEFAKCHNCHKFIDKKNYKQSSNTKKYGVLIKALMSFEIDVLEDCHSMISIRIKGDEYDAPELYQIWKENNEYSYVHFEKDTHNKLEKHVIVPSSFAPKLEQNRTYLVELLYGPHIIYVHQ